MFYDVFPAIRVPSDALRLLLLFTMENMVSKNSFYTEHNTYFLQQANPKQDGAWKP